jgi:hypothetical protein
MNARLQQIAPDAHGAQTSLAQADVFLADARNADNSNESRIVLAHNATVAAADAILAANGQRVTSGDNGHVLRLEAALDHVDGDTDELLERLDAARARRNEASYAGLAVGSFSVADALEATTEFVAMVRARVG